MMSNLDAAWATLGVFLLACGALPAVLATLEERRRPRTARLFHEPADGLPSLAWTYPAPAWAGAGTAFVIPPVRAARRRSARPARPSAPDTSAG